jgi:hypothetical protein
MGHQSVRWVSNSALEQAASAARPWQRAQTRKCVSGGSRPGTRPSLLTAGVMLLPGGATW